MADLVTVSGPEAAARLFLDRGMSLAEFAAVQGLDITSAARMLANPETVAHLRRLRDTGQAAIAPMGVREAHEILSAIGRDTTAPNRERMEACRLIMDAFKRGTGKSRRFGNKKSAVRAIVGEIIDVGGSQ